MKNEIRRSIQMWCRYASVSTYFIKVLNQGFELITEVTIYNSMKNAVCPIRVYRSVYKLRTENVYDKRICKLFHPRERRMTKKLNCDYLEMQCNRLAIIQWI